MNQHLKNHIPAVTYEKINTPAQLDRECGLQR